MWWRKNKTNGARKTSLEDFKIGDFVELEYKDPRTLGFNSSSSLTLTRFNHDELDNRVIRGVVSKNYYEPKPLDENIIEISTIKNDSVRKYLILSHEIQKISKMLPTKANKMFK